jgi:thymidylate kinase
MYIAIEGVKGIGKSTLLEKLQDYFLQQQIHFTVACPTKPISNRTISEWLFEKMPWVFQADGLKEMLYAHRSNVVAKATNWNVPLVIGDRSIVTSYATRLWKYQSPTMQIERVDVLEPLIPAPDVVIYLKADLNKVLARIRKRVSRCYGKEDENPNKIIQDCKAYEYIMQVKPARLNKTKWVVVDASQKPDKVFENTLQIIKKLTK